MIFPKVNLGDIFFSPTRDVADRNRIDRKHVDFLLSDAGTLRPVLGLELDDSSHTKGKAAERDAVKDAAFKSAGLPLVRLVNRSYTSAEIVAAIDRALSATTAFESQSVAASTGTSRELVCPSCGGQLVLRPSVPGRYKAFYGCNNYPRCRHTMPVTN